MTLAHEVLVYLAIVAVAVIFIGGSIWWMTTDYDRTQEKSIKGYAEGRRYRDSEDPPE